MSTTTKFKFLKQVLRNLITAKFTTKFDKINYTSSYKMRNPSTKIPSLTDHSPRYKEWNSSNDITNQISLDSPKKQINNKYAILLKRLWFNSRQKNINRNKRTRKSQNLYVYKTISFTVHRGSSLQSIQNNTLKLWNYNITNNMDYGRF